MRIFHSHRQSGHAPRREFHNGDWAAFAETPARVTAMLAAVGPVEEPTDRGLGSVLAVHEPSYVEFLQTAYTQWVAAGREGDALGYAFPVSRRRALVLDRIDAKLGRFSADVVTPIAAGTWDATYASAQAALGAVAAVLEGEPRAFALTRPPGHHAGADYCGGYCYLNASAIAARALADAGRKVAVLDVDYHHGNGTQDIFYESGDVFFASIHADPATDFPFFWGHADERGEGPGQGATLNLPLPRGTRWAEYERALGKALEGIAAWGADQLVVSYGADTFAGDPISHFQLTTPDMQSLGAAIAAARLPVVGIMEGGYAVDSLGANLAAFLGGLES
ncbi:histone deacetylase family protein [Erythrobacter arachoides]|uniref:Histone deacetylase family protein n=1 Tax=Aurantiacibacter arachoides TaxID=1850444 RepID=A0A845A0E4_9SPHN|nr:histone deacetylase family protein [Aurantiacibacter arachoides]MXO92942.1 histone deacetylase family protein [Aurantiacibacter arachoides]GGD53267.1 acetylpolyamine amidohydrolase [Aurantiacibacter arachoides]